MSELLEILDHFDLVLTQTSPEIASRLQPGLTTAEIEAQIASFSWKFPQDAFDLYQYHNGLSGKPGKVSQEGLIASVEDNQPFDCELNLIQFEQLYQQCNR